MKIKTSYPRLWARHVVYEFLETYPRGSSIFRWYLGRTEDEFNELLVNSLMTNQLMWRILKEIAEYLENLKKGTPRAAVTELIEINVLNKWRAEFTPEELSSIIFTISSYKNVDKEKNSAILKKHPFQHGGNP